MKGVSWETKQVSVRESERVCEIERVLHRVILFSQVSEDIPPPRKLTCDVDHGTGPDGR